MEIKKSEFTISAPRVSMCPKDTKAEYASSAEVMWEIEPHQYALQPQGFG